MKALAALLFGMTAWAAADDDPIQILMRVRDRVMENAQRIPNHTCVETISRDRYDYVGGPAPKSCDDLLGRRRRAGVGTLVRLATTDRLRLDVGLTALREVYSWAGASRFAEGEIDELVSRGAIGSGPFATMLAGIFEARAPGFVFEGETLLNGHQLLNYSFRVPEEESHYNVKAGNQWLVTGYIGTLLVDPETAELVRLTVRTEELPAASHVCEVDSTLEYGTVRLAGKDYLLPTLTRQRFINPDGAEAENTITFAACRDFRGESAVTFGEGAGAVEGKPQAAPTLPLELPSGLAVTVELASTIEADQAAAGDRIEGRLAAPIRDAAQKKIIVPEGAAVAGRLMRVETRYGHTNEVTIALRWESLEVNGVKAPFSVTPDRRSMSRRIAFELPQPGEGAYAVYRFSGEHVVVKSGLRSPWVTAKP